MFSLFGKKKYPTTVHPALQAQLQRIDSFPAAAAAITPNSAACTKYTIGGRPPAVTFSPPTPTDNPAIGFVSSDRPDNAVLMMNLPEDGVIELWQLASTQDLRLTRKLSVPIHPKQSTWTSSFLDDAACLPNGRALVAITHFDPARTGLFLYNLREQRFSTYVERTEPAFSVLLESQRISPDAAIVLHFTDVKREAAEVYYNYYNRFQLFTGAHPDGLEALALGLDIGNVKRWAVVDKKLYLHTHDPRTPSNPREAYWSLDLSKVVTD